MVAVALIGVGDIGRGTHLPALLRSPDVHLVAVADPVAEHHHAAMSLLDSGIAACADDGRTATERTRRRIGLTYRHDPAIGRLKSWLGHRTSVVHQGPERALPARRRSWARNDPAPAVAERVATAALDGATA